MIPADVQQALGLAAAGHTDAALTPQVDQAVERASAPTADGGTVQLWTAPTNGGGTRAYVRQLDAAGAPTDSGPISCAVSIAGGGRMGSEMSGQAGSHGGGSTIAVGGPLGDGHLSAQVEVDSSGAAMLFGQAPGAAKVAVVDSAGAVLGEAAATDGWFVLTLPASRRPQQPRSSRGRRREARWAPCRSACPERSATRPLARHHWRHPGSMVGNLQEPSSTSGRGR